MKLVGLNGTNGKYTTNSESKITVAKKRKTKIRDHETSQVKLSNIYFRMNVKFTQPKNLVYIICIMLLKLLEMIETKNRVIVKQSKWWSL